MTTPSPPTEISSPLGPCASLARALLNAAPVVMWFNDPDGVAQAFNAAFRDYTGMPAAERTGWADTVHPDDLARLLDERARAIPEGRAYGLQLRLRRADGAWRWHRLQVSPVVENGVRVAWVGSAVDIHDLLESEDRFRTVADSTPALLFAADAAGANTFVNRHFEAFVGRPGETMLGEGWLEVLHPDDRARIAALWARCVGSGTPYVSEHRFRRHDGVYRWFLVRVEPLKDKTGRVDHWFGACTDIDDQKQAEQKARDSEAQIRAMAEAMPQLAWSADAQGSVDWYNQRWYDYTGSTPEEVAGWGWRALVHPDHVDGMTEAIQHAWDSGEPWERTFPLRGRDGRYRWFLSRAEPVRDADGRVVRWFGTDTDVTEQVESEKLQQLLIQETSHRVKNSLALVSSLLTLQARGLTGEAHTAVTEAAARVGTVARMHDLLWRSARASTLDAATIVSELCQALGATSPLHHVSCAGEPIELSTEQAVPLALIVNELATNAIKHAYPTGQGGPVDIALRRSGDRLEVEVRDYGVGLPEGFLLERRSGSLGMRVVKALAQQLGAELIAEAAAPGARFALSIPLAYGGEP